MLLRLLSAMLVVVGVSGFFLPFWLGSLGEQASRIELPLANVKDIAISDDGHIFLALMFAGRIQKYNNDGEFVRNIAVYSAGGYFCIDIRAERLLVDVGRRRAIDELDLDGRPVNLDVPRPERLTAGGCALDGQVKAIEETFAGLRVSFKDDRLPLLIEPKLWHYSMRGPFSSWLMTAVGLLLWPEWRRGIVNMIKRGRERAASPSETVHSEDGNWVRFLAKVTLQPLAGAVFVFAFFFTIITGFSLLGALGPDEPPALAVASLMSLFGFGFGFTAAWGAETTEIKGWPERFLVFLSGGLICGLVLQVCFRFGSFFGSYFANEPTDGLSLWPSFSIGTLVIVGCIAYVIQILGLIFGFLNRRFPIAPWPWSWRDR